MPVVKVIDFGVAKAIQGRLTEGTVFTAFDHFIGTPAYVSPEQAERGDAQVDARSDIYSLGVLLYELLCGCTPFAGNDLSASRMMLLRARMRSEEALPPSRKLRTLVCGGNSSGHRALSNKQIEADRPDSRRSGLGDHALSGKRSR